jgi:hypothetical protein
MNENPEAQTPSAYWNQQIDVWKVSGQSQSQFCKANELHYHRFIYWRAKREGSKPHPQAKPVSGFAEVNYRTEVDTGLTLSLANGLVVRGIRADNLAVVRQLLDCL